MADESILTDPSRGPTYDQPLVACLLCASEKLSEFDRDYRGNSIVCCHACGARFMNPQYTDDWLQHYYSRYVPANGHSHAESWRSRPEVRRAGKTRALQLIANHVPVGRILMVGCGDGLELSIAKELGWSAEGLDIDPATTRRIADSVGVQVHCGAFEELPAEDGSFDAVFLDQVIEHPKNPADFLRKAFGILRAGGVLYLGLPNIGSLSNSFKTMVGRLGLRRRRRGRHYASQHHITYYRPGVFKALLERCYGFEVLLLRGSLKPNRRRLLGWLAQRLPFFDSSFVVIPRRPLGGGQAR